MSNDDLGVNPSTEPSFSALVEMALSRRAVLGGVAAAALVRQVDFSTPARAAGMAGPSLTFAEAPHSIGESHQVAPGYDASVLIRWGDKVLADAPAFDPQSQSAAAQARQFGYNNDFLGYCPLPAGSGASDHGLLVVNHEYTDSWLMFPGLTEKDGATKVTREQAQIELAAHGLSVIEIRRVNGHWRVVEDSAYARRITLDTAMAVSGPAAGHDRLKTKGDPSGRLVLGTLNNCAGGLTPWGTILTAEENFHQYFSGVPQGAEAAAHKRLGLVGKPAYSWGRHFDRFDVTREPNEPNRFGWLVEVDPYDPMAQPVKRTALGRFKHEAANVVVNANGRVSVYSGDDERFEYLYRFVSRDRVDLLNRANNRRLLDDGILYVAKFHADGRLTWLPLIFGNGPLNPGNGFQSQADVVIEARRAADLMGATPMDRPEDVETNPVTGKVYMMCTNNTKRQAEQTDAANPRANNVHGHVIEMVPPMVDGQPDHAALDYTWSVFLLAGPKGQGRYHPETSDAGWMSAPDNLAFDPTGRLWISTDQGSAQAANNIPDGMYAMETEGPFRALSKFFYACPRGAEMCGPMFTPDGKTLFVAVQHPGESKGSTFEAPSTRFPDFQPGMPPRPSVVAITKKDGGVIGS